MSLRYALEPLPSGSTWSVTPVAPPAVSASWTAVVFASCLIASQGTGANLGQRIGFQQPVGSGSTVFLRRAQEEPSSDLSSVLSEMRSSLGLKVTELAQILQVERQTVYAWLKPGSQAKVHGRNSERLMRIGQIAAHWRSVDRVRSARSWLVSPGVNGAPSLLDRMAQDDIDVSSIVGDLERAATRQEKRSAIADEHVRKKRVDELRRRGFKAPPGSAEYSSAQVRLESDDE